MSVINGGFRVTTVLFYPERLPTAYTDKNPALSQQVFPDIVMSKPEQSRITASEAQPFSLFLYFVSMIRHHSVIKFTDMRARSQSLRKGSRAPGRHAHIKGVTVILFFKPPGHKACRH